MTPTVIAVVVHRPHVRAAGVAVVALSLGSAFLYALTSVLQHGAVRTISSERAMRPWLLFDLLRHPRWLLSNLVDGGGYMLQFLALRAGSLVAVETLLVAGLLFALPLGAAASHRRPEPHDWWATIAVVAGLGGFLIAGRPEAGAGNTSRAGWIATAVVAGLLIAGLVAIAERGPRAWRAPVLGGAAGVVFGLTAALAKASGHLLDRGAMHALTSWQPYALAGLGLLGVVISQSAFQAGPLQASLPVLTIAEPLAAAAIGLAAFHEHVATHGLRLAGLSVAVAILAAGVVGLARSPLVAGEASAGTMVPAGKPIPPPTPVPPPAGTLPDGPAGGSGDGAGDGHLVTPPGRRRILRAVVRTVIGMALGALAVSVVSGRRNEVEGAAALLEHARWSWLLLAVPLEVASLLAYAALERRLLRAGDAPLTLRSLLQITLAGNAIQNSLPGGAAWAAGFAFGQFRRRGADSVLAGWTLLATGFVSNATLVVVSIVGVVVARGQASANDLVGAVLVVAVVGVALAVSFRLGVHARWAPRLVALAVRIGEWIMRRRARDPAAQDPAKVAREALDRLSAVRPTPGDWAVAGGWGISNWMLDCACLALAFPTVGAAVPWRGLLLAYGAGQLAANLPFTPGGLGAVEGSLTVALVAYGGAQIPTVAAVLVYRIITFWLLLMVGWGLWAYLRWSGR